MKKTLFLAVLAGAVLAGCVKNEEVVKSDGSPERITFDAPVVGVSTRATEIYGNYPKDKDFAVYALYHENAYSANSFTSGSIYMTNVTCVANKKGTGETPDYWVPTTTYYWPKNENAKLTFAAYAPAGMTNLTSGSAETATGVKWGATGFTFQNFTVDDEPKDQVDLLYSGRVYDQTKETMVSETDPDNVDNPYDGVTIPFKHALSSIIFKVKTEGDYIVYKKDATTGDPTTEIDNDKSTIIKLIRLRVNKVANKGTFAQGLTANKAEDGGVNPGWTTDANSDNVPDNIKDYYTVYTVPELEDKPGTLDWSQGKQLTNSDDEYVNGNPDGTGEDYGTTEGNQIPTDPSKANNGVRRSDLIVIPQLLDRAGEDNDVTVTIEYTMQTGDEGAVLNSKTFKLAVEALGGGNTMSTWEMGKRYIYSISIGLHKIYFNPTVTNWDDQKGELIEI